MTHFRAQPLETGRLILRILREVATDGVSEFLQAEINALDDAGFEQYLRYHFYICEKPELLGMSNHLLFVGEA